MGKDSQFTIQPMKLHSRDTQPDDGATKSLSYADGKLFIDGKHVPNATVHDDNKIVWTRQQPCGLWEHGACKPHANRLTGVVHSTISEDEAGQVTVRKDAYNTTVVPTLFNCKRGSNPLNSDVKIDDIIGNQKKEADDIDFGTLESDINLPDEKDKSHLIPWVSAKLQIPPMSESDDSFDVTTSTTKENLLHITISIDPDYFTESGAPFKENQMFNYFECKVGILGNSFEGYCTKYDANKPQGRGDKYHWYGSVAESANQASLVAYDEADGTSQTAANISQLAFVNAEQVSSELSVMNLLGLTLANPNDTFMSYMTKCMKHKIDSGYREDILGDADPDFIGESDVKAVADKYANFFKNDFGIAYIMKGVSTSSDLAGKFSDEDKKKMASYWQGATDGCLAKSADYNKAHHELSRIAYIKETVGLKAYVDDGGKKWASNVYDAISTPSEIKNMASVDTFHNGLYHKYIMLLYCLDPSIDYASKLFNHLLETKLKVLQKYFDGSESEIVNETIQSLSTTLVTRILNGDDSVFQNLKAELNKMKGDLGVKDQATFSINMATLAFKVVRLALFGKAIYKGSMAKKMNEAAEEEVKKLTLSDAKFKFLSGAIFKIGMAIGYGFALYQSIEMLKNWSHLTDAQRATLIVHCARYVVGIAEGLIGAAQDIDSYIQTKNYYKLIKFMENEINANEADVMIEAVEEIDGKEEVGVLTGEQLEEFLKNTKSGRIFNITSKAIEGLTLVLVAAQTAVLAYKLYTDFADDAPTFEKVLDSLQVILSLGQVVCMGLELAFEFAYVPMVGAVLAIAGVVVAIVLLILDKLNPKETPAEKFIDDQGPKYFKKITIDPKVVNN